MTHDLVITRDELPNMKKAKRSDCRRPGPSFTSSMERTRTAPSRVTQYARREKVVDLRGRAYYT